MRSLGRTLGAGLAASSIAVTSSQRGFAAQTDITISMASAPATPRIQGPTVLGSKPASPFQYTVPATGQAQLAFAATGLPAGLAIDASSGTISGTTPAAGSYPMTITATNAMGSAKAILTLTSGPTIALTPTMGWNSYDSYGSSVTESEALMSAQAMKSHLQPYGWNAVVVDFLWFDPEQIVDANGRYLPSPTKFPSSAGGQGLKPLADKVHALGLSFGIHIMRGIPRKSVTANSPIANSSYAASQAGNTNDPCPWDSHMWGVHGDTAAGKAWYDSIFALYAGWGIDFVKVDDMINPYTNSPSAYHQSETDAIRASIDKTGRSIVLSLSPGPMQTRDAANLNTDANMWRMVNDFWDISGLSKLPDVFNAAGNWQGTSGLTVGHWPDADMLPLGYIGPRCPVHPAGPSALSHNEQVAVMSLWGILPSPLIFGGNPTRLDNDAWSIALLTNEEVLAVNQDAAGTHATRIAQQGTTEVWARDLVRGRKAVALFNRGAGDGMVSVTFAQLGVSGTPVVRDLWNRADVTGMTTGISVNIPHDGAMMYTVSPPGGGADVDAGDAPGGGSQGDAAAGGGGNGAGGSAGASQQEPPSGVAGTGSPEGSVGGASGASGDQPSPEASSASGCSCSTRQEGRATMPLLLACAAVLVATKRRRALASGRLLVAGLLSLSCSDGSSGGGASGTSMFGTSSAGGGGPTGSGGSQSEGTTTGGLAAAGADANGGSSGAAGNGTSGTPGDTAGGANTGGRADAGSAGADGRVVKSTGCGATSWPASKTGYTINVGGTNRSYILRIPDLYDTNRPYRLIVAFHWLNGTADNVANGGGGFTSKPFYGLWDLAGGSTIFVAPQGINNGWSDSGHTSTTEGQDIKLTRALIDELTSKLCVDKSRIFAEGFSMGGSMSYAVGCAMSDVVRGVAVHSGGPMSGCVKHDKPLPYFMTHGTKDSVCTYPQYGVPQLDDFAKLNGCMNAALPTPTGNGSPSCIDLTGCKQSDPTRACLFVGDHTPSPPSTSNTWVPAETWKFISQF